MARANWVRYEEIRDKFYSGFHPHDAFEMHLTPQEVNELIEVFDGIYEERDTEASRLKSEVTALRFVLDDLMKEFPQVKQRVQAVNELAKHYKAALAEGEGRG